MNMRATIQYLALAAFLACLSLMTGCGGGGGGGGGGGTPVVASTVVKGTASKGIIKSGGIVNIYAVDATTGAKGSLLKTTTITTNDGTFTADLGSYTGPIIVEVSGKYDDEATKTEVTINPATPLHAAVDLVDNSTHNNRPIAVTPLTEVAYGMMGTNFTGTMVAAKNKIVSDLFKIDDIIATQPVASTAAGMKAAGIYQQAYTMALTTLSQMAKDSGGGAAASFTQIKTLLDSFENDIKAGSLGTVNIAAFTTALATVKSTADMAEFNTAASNLSSVGKPSATLTLKVAGVPSGVQLGSIKATITLPAGVSIRDDGTTGESMTGMIVPAGTAATGQALATGSYQEATRTLVLSLISSAGFGVGDCATITVDVESGTTLTPASIPVTLNEAKDAGPTYGPVTGVTVSLH